MPRKYYYGLFTLPFKRNKYIFSLEAQLKTEKQIKDSKTEPKLSSLAPLAISPSDFAFESFLAVRSSFWHEFTATWVVCPNGPLLS